MMMMMMTMMMTMTTTTTMMMMKMTMTKPEIYACLFIYLPTICRNENPTNAPPIANIVPVNGWIWKTLKRKTRKWGGASKEVSEIIGNNSTQSVRLACIWVWGYGQKYQGTGGLIFRNTYMYIDFKRVISRALSYKVIIKYVNCTEHWQIYAKLMVWCKRGVFPVR